MRENIILVHDIAFVVILIVIAYLYIKSLSHKADIKEIKNDLKNKDYQFNKVREELDNACMEVELIYQKINTHFTTKTECSIITKEEIKKDAEIILALKEKYSFKPLSYQLIDFTVIYPSSINKSVSTIDVFKDVQNELEKNNIFISLSFLDVIMNMNGDTSKEENYVKLLIIKSKKKLFKKPKI
jgi:hypothetical protein